RPGVQGGPDEVQDRPGARARHAAVLTNEELAAVMTSLCLALAISAPASHLAVLRPAPDFALRTQDEKPLRLADLRGKVVLVSFIFTTCNGSCPATTARMSAVAAELERRGLLRGDGVRLVSITLDPERDTPAALRSYRALYDIEGERWQFLTGPAAEVKKV